MVDASAPPVVVGVDGSESALNAVRWAADTAVRDGRRLVLVHSWSWPFPGTSVNPMPGSVLAELKAKADKVLADAMLAAQERAPELIVSGELEERPPIEALTARAEDADLVVVGSRGHGGFTGLLLGSVTVGLAGRTHAPLVVVREGGRSDGPVVLGVDDGPRAADVAERAVTEASLRAVPVVAVRAWSVPTMLPDWPEGVVELMRNEAAEAHARTDEVLAPLKERHPEVTVQQEVARSSAASALIEASEQAQLVVVGSRGRGGFAGLVLGSTSQAVLHHAHCPVMVVGHQDDTHEPRARA